MKPYWCKYTNC